ncbi:hypothetical protein OWM07_02515 [Deferribacter thermophilus]|uniref:hypothetical protein n=1 Tax=Deferribacter thermophilus TaxID=53573 RepID=UPI003C1AA2AD
MKGVYGYIALLIATLSFMISFSFKMFYLDTIDITVFIRDFIVFFVVYIISKYVFKNIEKMFNNYRKIL